jgi:hypothetical protein
LVAAEAYAADGVMADFNPVYQADLNMSARPTRGEKRAGISDKQSRAGDINGVAVPGLAAPGLGLSAAGLLMQAVVGLDAKKRGGSGQR